MGVQSDGAVFYLLHHTFRALVHLSNAPNKIKNFSDQGAKRSNYTAMSVLTAINHETPNSHPAH